jgi:hypothetical protein
MARVNSLPAHSTVALEYDSFYNRQEYSLSSFHTTVNSVQVESRNGFYLLQGPVFSN